MNVNYLKMGKTWLLVFLFFIVGVTNAQAFELADKLTLNGMLRQTAVMSIGTSNAYLETYQATEGSGDKPDFNLIRTMLQLELNYQPTDVMRFYMKGRATHDQTYMWQSDLGRYNTTPTTYEREAWDLKTGYGDDNYMLEIWEVWANIEFDLLWIRLGKQQIAWGDLPGIRIADKVNPLDKSWHLTNEPEEYENIRIPEWAARVYFTFPETMTGFFNEVFIDGYWNPGNIHPDNQPAPGSPYMNAFSGNPNEMAGGPGGFMNYPTGAPQADPDFILHGEEDEYGIRLGFNVDEFQVTFNYMSMHNDFAVWDFYNAPVQQVFPGGPPQWENLKVGTMYPEIDVYAMTMSYAFSNPINTSITFEGSYTPNQPWQAVDQPPFGPVTVPAYAEGKYWRTAVYLERNIFFMNSFSRFFFPAAFRVMYYRHWIDNEDRDNVKLTPAPYGTGNRLDWAMDDIYVSYTLPFGEGANWQINPTVNWNPEGAYKIKCFLKYSPNTYWRFDLGAMWQGGSSERAFLNSNNGWNDEMYFRLTYSF